jgi:hypothetical protein
MAVTTIRELLVRIGVSEGDSTKAVAGLDDAMTGLVDVATKVVAVVAAASAAIAALAVSAAGAADSVDKGAQGAAVSTDAYQELSFAAGQAGTDIETVTKALGKQTVALGQMEEGTGAAYDALTALGVTYADLAGLSVDEQFSVTATAIAGLADEQDRLDAATAIYGEDMAQKLLPLLGLGADGIGALRDQAHDLGLVMSEEAIASGVLFSDTLDTVTSTVSALKNLLGLALLPTLTDLLTRLRDWYQANAQVITSRLTEWAGALAAGIERLAGYVEAADDVVQRVFGGWEPILAAAAAAVAAIGAALAVLAGAKVWLAITGVLEAIGIASAGAFAVLIGKVLAAAAVLVGLVLVVDDLITYFQGGDSALGRFLDTFGESEGILGSVARLLVGLGSAASSLWTILGQLAEIWWAVFSVTSLPVLEAVGSALLWIAEVALAGIAFYLETVVLPLMNTWLDVFGAISGALSTVSGALGIESSVPESSAAGAGDIGVAAASAAFGPTSTGSSVGGPQSTSVQVQGSNLTVSGVGLSAEEVAELFEQMQATQARQTAAALDGAEV